MWFSLSAPNSGDGFEFGEPYIFFFDRDLKTSPAETADNVYELATDTFVVRDGKIVTQTFVGKLVPKG